MRRRCSLLAGGALVLVMAGTASAQEAANGAAAPSLQERLQPAPTRVELVPRSQPVARAAAPTANRPAQPMAPSNQSVALMVAGGALFVAGVIAGGDVGGLLMLGGAVVGAYGVYLHFIR
jgi:hypothetical protein